MGGCGGKNSKGTARDRKLLRAGRAAALPKVVKSQNIVNNDVPIPKGQPCSLFQSGRCSFARHHYSSGQQWIHVCATCIRVVGQKNLPPETECKRKFAHDNRNGGLSQQGRQWEN